LENKNNLLNKIKHEPIDSKGSVTSIFLTNISCEEMVHRIEGKVLVCFYENRNCQEISISIFNPDNNFEVISSLDKIYISTSNLLGFIETAVSKNKKMALVCFVNSGGAGAFCFSYNIDENNYTAPKKYSESCRPNISSIKTFYFQQANQFIFGCSGGNVNFNFALFNENAQLLYESESKDIEECFGYDAMSLAYIPKYSKYSVIVDANCRNGQTIRLFSINFINKIIQSTLSPPILPQSSSTLISSKISETKYSLPITHSQSTTSFSGSIVSSHYNIFNHSSISLITIQSSLISYGIDSTSIPNKISSTFPTKKIYSTTFTNKIISTTPTNIIHSTSISNKIISNTSTNTIHSTSILNNIHSNAFLTSFNSNLSFLYPSSSVSFPNYSIKCNKYLNYKRDKCIDSIPEGFYLFNKKLGIIEKCHISCKICEKGPDEFSQNCQKCQSDSDSLEDGNCINKNISCPENKPLLNKEINQCVEFCSYDKILNKKCIINSVTVNNLEIINENIKEIILNQNMDEDANIIIEGNLIKCQISTTKNIKNNNNDLSKIDFNECETKIKNKYEINYIIIQKMDILINNITKVKYDLYNPKNKEKKLDLSIVCDNDKIQVYTPLQATDEYIDDYHKISEQGYNILDSNDNFYNDICSQFTSEDNTDMILLDRKKKYYDIDLTQCDEGCSFKNVNLDQKQLQCQCPIKNDFKISKLEFDKKDFINSFYKVRKYSNFKVVKCFKLIFSKKGQFMNYGSFFLTFIVILFLISQIIFHTYSKELVANLIKKMLKSISLDLVFHVKSNPKKKKAPLKKEKHIMKLLNKSKTLQHNNINIIKNKNRNKKESIIESSNNSTKKFLIIYKNKDKVTIPKKAIINKYSYYNDEELNSLNYNEAIKIDKRGYFQYYISLIKKKQLLFFTFISKKDYNLRIIKFSLFLISISLYFAVNSLFFIDENIHKIHEDHGIFNFLYQLPQIIYSSLISVICNLFINSLALSESYLLKVKKTKNKELLISQSLNLYICLRKKMYIFYIVGLIMLSFIWYFISGFCAVYKNTQIIYLKSCSLSFCLSMIYPFALNFVPGLFRIPALKSKRKKYLYIIGNIIALF